MSGPRRTFAGLAAAMLVAWPAFGQTSATVHVRTTEDLAPCLERVVAGLGFGMDVRVEAGDPTSTDGTDLVVAPWYTMTRVLESGRADDRWTARLGFHGAHVAAVPILGAPVGRSPRFEEARRLALLLDSSGAQQAFGRCAGARATSRDAFGYAEATSAYVAGTARYATSVADWWMPACSLQRNKYTDRNEVVGAPNAFNQAPRGEPSQYRGMISLGQGGYVVVDMGQVVSNGPGHDVRVHQFTSGEPVTLYGGNSPAGPFTLIAFRRYCGNRIPGGAANQGYCDFDLAEGGVASARYLRVEDGELYPCLRADTTDEGADIDAVELLNQ
jgi:hypothetical protein